MVSNIVEKTKSFSKPYQEIARMFLALNVKSVNETYKRYACVNCDFQFQKHQEPDYFLLLS